MEMCSSVCADCGKVPACRRCNPCNGTHHVGHIAANGYISIFDVLEILKYEAGLENVMFYRNGNVKCQGALTAALITEDSEKRGTPDKNDAIEILSFLAELENELEKLLAELMNGGNQ